MKRYPLTPSGDPVDRDLYDASLRFDMLRSRVAKQARDAVTSSLVAPVENALFKHWLNEGRWAGQVESMGLPRRSVEAFLGDALDVKVDPRKLTKHVSMVHSFSSKSQGKRARSQFIWGGEWDLKTFDFKEVNRYHFVLDIWENRENLYLSNAYLELISKLEEGKPFRSHQAGIFLNTPFKVIAYLNRYLNYMKDMQENGFDATLGKDRLGVAVGREGQLMKLNRGLHRLAMAQVVGVERVVVRVMGVHEKWWKDKTNGRSPVDSLHAVNKELCLLLSGED